MEDGLRGDMTGGGGEWKVTDGKRKFKQRVFVLFVLCIEQLGPTRV